jgi:uncharacterized delta-60 repeat protein
MSFLSVSPRRRSLLLGALLVVVLTGLVQARPAASRAMVDRSFGGGRGWATASIGKTMAVAYGAIRVRGGRTVVVGQATTRSGNGQIIVLRYRQNGSLDRAFGSQGIFKTRFPTAKGPFIATSVVQTRSGKLLVAGGYGLGSMLVLRLTSSGHLDCTFGSRHRGRATIPVAGVAQSVAVQRNGSILVGGSDANANGRPMVVARLTKSGRLDRRYGHNGVARVLFWSADLAASAGVERLITTSDGGVIGFGHLDYIGSDGHGSAGIFRLSSEGRLAPGYGTGGHAEIAFTKPTGGFAQWFPCAMTSSRNAVTVTGDGSVDNSGSLLSVRLTARGRLDSAFGIGGRSVAPGPRSDNYTTCGATATGRGLTAGVGAALIQLNAHGFPNRRFASGGRLRISRPRGVAINAVVSSGRRTVTVAGSAGNAIYVARYRF